MTARFPHRFRPGLQACGLLLAVCFAADGLHAAVRVHVLAAPAPALAALRALSPDIHWQEEAAESADLILAWQADAYARARVLAGELPVLVLAQRPGMVALRPQDAALYWAPSLHQQIQLARQIQPALTRIGVLYRPAQQADIDALPVLPGITVVARPIAGTLQARDVAELAQRVDMLVASNDDTLFNRDSAKLALLTAYRHQRAWIGPTPAFVNAGAVATRSVAKDTLLRTLIDRVRYWQRQHRLGPSQSLPADQVICNEQVARSLSVILPEVLGCSGRNDG